MNVRLHGKVQCKLLIILCETRCQGNKVNSCTSYAVTCKRMYGKGGVFMQTVKDARYLGYHLLLTKAIV